MTRTGFRFFAGSFEPILMGADETAADLRFADLSFGSWRNQPSATSCSTKRLALITSRVGMLE